jgi:hypothetical protein
MNDSQHPFPPRARAGRKWSPPFQPIALAHAVKRFIGVAQIVIGLGQGEIEPAPRRGRQSFRIARQAFHCRQIRIAFDELSGICEIEVIGNLARVDLDRPLIRLARSGQIAGLLQEVADIVVGVGEARF